MYRYMYIYIHTYEYIDLVYTMSILTSWQERPAHLYRVVRLRALARRQLVVQWLVRERRVVEVFAVALERAQRAKAHVARAAGVDVAAALGVHRQVLAHLRVEKVSYAELFLTKRKKSGSSRLKQLKKDPRRCRSS